MLEHLATTAIIFGKWWCMLSSPSNFYEGKKIRVVNKTALEYPVVLT